MTSNIYYLYFCVILLSYFAQIDIDIGLIKFLAINIFKSKIIWIMDFLFYSFSPSCFDYCTKSIQIISNKNVKLNNNLHIS